MNHNLVKKKDNNNPFKLPDNLKEAIQSFCIISDLPITFFDNEGSIIWECNSDKKICAFSDFYGTKDSTCSKNLVSSAKIATTLGEPYIFLCCAGFSKIAISLIIEGNIKGCFIAGPIAMGKINESIVENIFRINLLHEFPEKIPKFTFFLSTMKITSPKEVAHLSNLLNSCVLSSISHNTDYEKINTDFKEQAKIGEDVLVFKKKNISLLYPYNVEKELVQKVKIGDANGAQESMQTLLNEVLIIEAGNLDLVKTTMLEVCAVLARAAVEGGASLQQVFEKDFNYVNSINGAESLHDLRLKTAELVEHFSLYVFDSLYLGNSHIISETIKYVNGNYMNKISLKKIADTLHINPSYLSMHFNKEMSQCFTDFVNEVRIKNSKDLLATTTLSLLEISIDSGFEEQSYFTKVFKKFTGITPSQYRKKTRTTVE